MDDGVVVEAEKPRSTGMHSILGFPLEPSELLVDGIGAPGFKIRAANSWGARSQASLLINRLYSRRGYRSDPLPDEVDARRLTLVASMHGALVGTLTIGFDSDELLLADDLFPDEVGALRDSGRQLCEFTKLAVDGLLQSQRVLAAMFHVAFIHAHRVRGCDNLLIEVNPRHRRFYEAKLGFEVVGPVRTNRRVNAPALLLSLDLWHAHAQVAAFGGRPEACREERSLYPFAFSATEEEGIVARLQAQRQCHAMAQQPYVT
jgi:hypothetical protein